MEENEGEAEPLPVDVGIEGLRDGVADREWEPVTDRERVWVAIKVRELVPVSERERVVDADADADADTDAEPERDTDVSDRDSVGRLAVGEWLPVEVGE